MRVFGKGNLQLGIFFSTLLCLDFELSRSFSEEEIESPCDKNSDVDQSNRNAGNNSARKFIGNAKPKDQSCTQCFNYSFELIEGNEAVCSAFEGYLNATRMRHPYCNIENREPANGILPSVRRELTDQEVYDVHKSVYHFNGHSSDPRKEWFDRTSTAFYRRRRFDAWVYDHDIDKDGVSEQVLMWQIRSCAGGWAHKQYAHPYVLNEISGEVDINRTDAFFVKPEEQRSSGTRWGNFVATDNDFFFFENASFMSALDRHPNHVEFNIFRYETSAMKQICNVKWIRKAHD